MAKTFSQPFPEFQALSLQQSRYCLGWLQSDEANRPRWEGNHLDLSDNDSTSVKCDSLKWTNSPSRTLRVFNFGFNLPITATVEGIWVQTYRSKVGTIREWEMYLTKDGINPVGENKSDDDESPYPYWEENEFAEHGGLEDLWETTWTPTDINRGTFGFLMAVNSDDSSFATASIEWARITVRYSDDGDFLCACVPPDCSPSGSEDFQSVMVQVTATADDGSFRREHASQHFSDEIVQFGTEVVIV